MTDDLESRAAKYFDTIARHNSRQGMIDFLSDFARLLLAEKDGEALKWQSAAIEAGKWREVERSRAEAAERESAELRAELEKMTRDRNAWEGAAEMHCADATALKARLESAEMVVAAAINLCPSEPSPLARALLRQTAPAKEESK